MPKVTQQLREVAIGVRVNALELALLARLAEQNDLPIATAVRREALRAARRVIRRGQGFNRSNAAKGSDIT